MRSLLARRRRRAGRALLLALAALTSAACGAPDAPAWTPAVHAPPVVTVDGAPVGEADATRAAAEGAAAEDAATAADRDPGQALIAGVEAFEVAGVPVLLKRTPGKPLISAGLYIRGGSVDLAPEDAGLERLMAALVRDGGSEATPREALLAELEAMGTTLGAASGRQHLVFSLDAVRKHWTRSFELFVEAVRAPALPADELERIRARLLEYIKGLSDNPDRYVSLLASDLLFEGHPYAQRSWGTLENVSRFGVEDVARLHAARLTRDRMLVVVVGDMTQAELTPQLEGLLSGLPATGAAPPPAMPPFAAHPPRLAHFARPELPTDYLIAYFEAPPPAHDDHPALVIATSLLRARLFEQLRTRRNLTYAVSAGVADDLVNHGYLYLTSRWPTAALVELYDQVEAMQRWLVNERDLEHQVATFITRYYMGLETLSAQRRLLADAELYEGGWQRSAGFIERLRAVTPEDLRRVMNTHVRDLQVGFYGDPARLDPELITRDPADANVIFVERAGFPTPDAANPPVD